MRIVQKDFSPYEFFRTYLTLVNFGIKDESKRLKDSEINLLSEFMCLPPKYDYHRFSSLAKKKVRQQAKEERGWALTAVNVNNKLYEMRDKGFLWKDEDNVLYLNKVLDKGMKLAREQFNNGRFQITYDFTWQTNQE